MRQVGELRDRVRRDAIVHAKYDDVMVIAEAGVAEHGRQSARARRQVKSVIELRRCAVRITSISQSSGFKEVPLPLLYALVP